MRAILTVNAGSSSLKAALYRLDDEPRLVYDASFDRLGIPGGEARIRDADGTDLGRHLPDLDTHEDALRFLVGWLKQQDGAPEVAAVGHRVVHGGPHYRDPARITGDMLAALRDLIPLDPQHLPQALACIDIAQQLFPDVPEVACFDTAFHKTMPDVATRFPLPLDVTGPDAIRYGFHGLSCEYVQAELERIDPERARGRTVIAHLGNGASMTAVHHGRSVDTSMALTPAAGLVMGTRSGDLDPGLLLYLLTVKGIAPDELDRVINKRSGLLGVSETTSDMRDLLAHEKDDPRAALAIAIFCYQARKFLGAYAAVLGGLDTVVFTGGIGEHAAPIRARICEQLGLFLGLRLDHARNAAHAPVISAEDSRVVVRIVPTNEDVMVARDTARLLHLEG